MEHGVDPATILLMRHRKTGTDSLRGPIGKAAKLDASGGKLAVYRAVHAAHKPACAFSGVEAGRDPIE